jgi:hypothetical protein
VPRRKRGPIRAVGFNAGPPQYERFALPEQKPFFNVSKGIAKPFVKAPEKKYPAGVVPLKSLQYGTHDGCVLFNAPEMIDIAILKQPVMVPSSLRMEDAVQEVNPAFPMPYAYNDGIRPSMRALKEQDVLEPTGPVFRPSVQQYAATRPNPYRTGYLPDDEIVRQVRAL